MWRRFGAGACVIALALLPACSRQGAGGAPAARPADATQAPAPPPATTTNPGATNPAATNPAASTSPTTNPGATNPLPARFHATVTPLPAGLAAQMRGTTWQPGCPVPLRELRLLTLRYWGFDGQVHQGPMVVNRAVASQVVSVFRRLFQARFPVQEMHLALQYLPGHDDPNDTRNYTSGFNCRPVVTARGPMTSWSQHAYGLAIDVNPIQNPYVTADGYVRNLHARPYRDRSLRLLGMIHPGDDVVRAFAAVGWGWGGHWSGSKDYMHFSSTGR
jgi:D-alanyl-D-alanine carboxypeptidase